MKLNYVQGTYLWVATVNCIGDACHSLELIHEKYKNGEQEYSYSLVLSMTQLGSCRRGLTILRKLLREDSLLPFKKSLTEDLKLLKTGVDSIEKYGREVFCLASNEKAECN